MNFQSERDRNAGTRTTKSKIPLQCLRRLFCAEVSIPHHHSQHSKLVVLGRRFLTTFLFERLRLLPFLQLALALSRRKVLMTSNVMPCTPRLISSMLRRSPLMLVLLLGGVGIVCFAFCCLEKALPAHVHSVLLILALCLHREELKILVRTLWPTASVTPEEPLHVHGCGAKDSCLHFFFCDHVLNVGPGFL